MHWNVPNAYKQHAEIFQKQAYVYKKLNYHSVKFLVLVCYNKEKRKAEQNTKQEQQQVWDAWINIEICRHRISNTKAQTDWDEFEHHTCSEASAEPCVSEVGWERTQGQLTWTRRSVSWDRTFWKSSRSFWGSSDERTTPTYEPGVGDIMSGNM